MKLPYFLMFLLTFILPFNGKAQSPSINAFTPVSGPLGTIVTITGNGFDEALSNNIVRLGAVQAELLTASTTQLTIRVVAGVSSASTIEITNLISKKTGSSQTSFTVTYPGGKITASTFFESVWTVGDGPFSIASGDFNGDNKADIAVANYNANTVSVLVRNSSNTGFNTKVDFPVAANPRMIVVADFNSDGKLDLATASNFTSRFISVLIRNSNPIESGGFTINSITTPFGLSAIATGDINGDGKIDLVSGNYSSNNVSVFLRNSNNTGFSHAGNYPAGTVVTNVSTGDFNSDGRLDVATINWTSNSVSILLRNSSNTGFNAAQNYSVGTNPRGIAVGDFNNDGRSDLAIANHTSLSASVLLRNSTNTGFNAAVHYPLGIFGQLISVADFNGDGKQDLIVNGFPETDPNKIMILLNNGLGNFQTPIKYSASGAIRSLSVSDFNGDGMADFVVGNNNGNHVTLYESDLTIWKGDVNDDWNLESNWWGSRVPSATSHAVVMPCTVCPKLNNVVQIRRFWIDNAQLTMNDFKLEAGEDVSVQNTKLVGGGAIQAADILEFSGNTVEGNLILKKMGGEDNVWKGNNHYKKEISIINLSTKTIYPAAQFNDLVQN